MNHLTGHGCMEPGRLYESPWIDWSPRGVEGVFTPPDVDTLLSILEEVRTRAIA